MISPVMQPNGWTRTDVENDTSWIYHLSGEEIEALENALRHALSTGKTFFQMSQKDFPLEPRIANQLREAVGTIQTGVGFRLLRGFPVQHWTEDELRIFYWGVGLHLGVPRPQGKASSFMSDVRNAGGVYRAATGRGYNTNARLDFHADGSDLVGLLVVRTAKAGGESLIASSISAHNVMLAKRPDLVKVLYEPFIFSRQGEQAAEEAPYYAAPVFGFEQGRFVCRHIRNHITSAQVSFPEVPRLTAEQTEALDMLDEVLASDELCFRMYFEPGDLQFINNHIVLHARTEYEDYEEPERKRFLLRLWLSLPEGQPLPANFKDVYKDVRPGSVRGGFRGVNITPEIRAFEERIASEHGMHFDIYQDLEAAQKADTVQA